MSISTCLSESQVTDFASGRLTEEAIEVVAQHLAVCPVCEHRVAQHDSRLDPLISAVRDRRPPDDSAEASELEQLVAQTLRPETPQEATSISSAGDTWTEDQEPILGQRWHLGQYELIEEIGWGAMGTVYRAVHTRLKRPFAVKVLPPHRRQDPHAVDRFHREMEAVGKLHHPNIVTATDAGFEDDRHFLVMEFVRGLDLSELVRRLGPLPISEACELVRQAAIGLHHAHQVGLIHRDVKPSNLMLCEDGTVKVLDLGLALLQEEPERVSVASPIVEDGHPATEATGSSYTKTGQILGTREYMAPEQTVSSHDVDRRADVYSLGCTLYKLLSGEPPFSRRDYPSRRALAAAHAGAPLPLLCHSRPDCPASLSLILERMLAKQREQRPRTAAEVASALQVYAHAADLPSLLAVAQGQPALQPLPTVAKESGSTMIAPDSIRNRFRHFCVYALFGLIAAAVGAATMSVLMQAFRDRSGQLVTSLPSPMPFESSPTKKNIPTTSRSAAETATPFHRVASSAAHALRFDSAGSQLKVSGSSLIVRSTSRFTIETNFRLTGTRLGYFVMGNEGTRYPTQRQFLSPFDMEGWRLEIHGHDRQAVVSFAYRDRHIHQASNRAVIPPLGTSWHTLAFSSDGSTVFAWIDGKQVLTCKLSRFPSPVVGPPSMNRNDLALGSAVKEITSHRPSFEVRSLKLSRDVLYVGDHDPPTSYQVEPRTQSLLDFHRPGLATLPDLSGQHRDGRATAVQWVELSPDGESGMRE